MKQKYPLIIAGLLAATLASPLALAESHGKVPQLQENQDKYCPHKDGKDGKYCPHKDGKHGKYCPHKDGKHGEHHGKYKDGKNCKHKEGGHGEQHRHHGKQNSDN